MFESTEMLQDDGNDVAVTDSKYGRHRNQQAKRVRTNFTDFQLRRLDETFNVRPFPSRDLINTLSGELDLSYFSIKTWFQNKRSKSRRNGSFDLQWSAAAPPSDLEARSDNSSAVSRSPCETSLTLGHVTQLQSQRTRNSHLSTAELPLLHAQTDVLKDLEKCAASVINKPTGVNSCEEVSTVDVGRVNSDNSDNSAQTHTRRSQIVNIVIVPIGTSLTEPGSSCYIKSQWTLADISRLLIALTMLELTLRNRAV